ncbi:MAG: hypothetical protein CSB24_02260 [Deltaproteobacteria bacterium]|nr:MAG: hypothetical protein CSB24_02260 [Deltaproteobacteria bacterium]
MKITLYYSPFCPRCLLAKKYLHQLKADGFPELEIEEVDILPNFKRARQDEIKMIPAIKSGKNRLSGVFLTRKKIAAFLGSLG